jgi:ribonuclease HI
MKLINIYFDGGAGPTNPGNAYGSYEVQSSAPELNHKVSRIQFGHGSNNQAEYLSLIAALKWLRHQTNGEVYRLEIFTDSMLVRNQVARKWKSKCVHIKELRDEVLELLSPYKHWEIKWRGRIENVARFGH